MAGAVGGAFISYIAGGILEHFKELGHIETGYVVMFAIAGSAYHACMDYNDRFCSER